MENNFFSTKRFALYFQLYSKENWKKFLGIVGVVWGIFILYFSIMPYISGCYEYKRSTLMDPMWNSEMNFFYIMFPIIASVISAMMFSALRNKPERIRQLTLPASDFEKYLTYFIIYVLAIYMIYFVGFFIADGIRVLTAPIYAQEFAVVKNIPLKYLVYYGNCMEFQEGIAPEMIAFHNNEIKWQMVLYWGSLVLNQAFFALASCIWPKRAFIKGFLSLIVFWMFVVVSFLFSMKIFGDYHFQYLQPRFQIFKDFDFTCSLGIVIITIVSIGFFVLSYFRYKEQESINRW